MTIKTNIKEVLSKKKSKKKSKKVKKDSKKIMIIVLATLLYPSMVIILTNIACKLGGKECACIVFVLTFFIGLLMWFMIIFWDYDYIEKVKKINN